MRGVMGKTALSHWLQREAAAILRQAAEQPAELAARQVQVPRLTGREDSNRYGSLDMVLQHLVIVGRFSTPSVC